MKRLKLLKKEPPLRNAVKTLKDHKKSLEHPINWDKFMDFSLNTKEYGTDSALSASKVISSSSSVSEKLSSTQSTTEHRLSSEYGTVGETMILSNNRRNSKESVSSNKDLSVKVNEVPQTSTIMLPDVSTDENESSLDEDGEYFLKKVSIISNDGNSTYNTEKKQNNKENTHLINSHYLLDMSDAESNSSSESVKNGHIDNVEDNMELFDTDPIPLDDRKAEKKHVNLLRTPVKNKSSIQHLPLSPASPKIISTINSTKSIPKVKPFTISDLSGGVVQLDDLQTNATKSLPVPENMPLPSVELNSKIQEENQNLNFMMNTSLIDLENNDHNNENSPIKKIATKNRKRGRKPKSTIKTNDKLIANEKLSTHKPISPQSAISNYKNIITEIHSPRRILDISTELDNTDKIPKIASNDISSENIMENKNPEFTTNNPINSVYDKTVDRVTVKKMEKTNLLAKKSNHKNSEKNLKVKSDKKLNLKKNRKRRSIDDIDNGNNVLRRSQRHRVKPLRYWENEYIDYKITEEGLVVNQVVENNQKKYTLSERLFKRHLSKKKSMEKSPVVVEPISFTIIDPNTSTQEHHHLVWPKQLVKLNYKNINNKTPKLQTDTYLKYDCLSVGQVVIRPKAEKGLYLSKDHIVMHVLEGYGIVTIAKKQENISSGTSIIIPKENVYNVQNLSKKRCLRILFVICESR